MNQMFMHQSKKVSSNRRVGANPTNVASQKQMEIMVKKMQMTAKIEQGMAQQWDPGKNRQQRAQMAPAGASAWKS